jgi:predicted RNase H-like HicB family nuclease
VLAIRDATRVVAPAPGRLLPDTFVRRIEHALELVLGPAWLAREPVPAPAGSEGSTLDQVVVLDAVVDRFPPGGVWCSFLPSEPAVMGFGPTRHAALGDLKGAAALWIGASRDSILLVTDTVV